MAVRFENGIRVGNSLIVEPAATVRGLTRAAMDEESLTPFTVPMTSLRVWDNLGGLLPTTAATDDLAIVGNTFGTGSPTIETGDLKAAGATTRYARMLVAMPDNYEAAADVVLRLHAGMKTTVADTTATVDVEAYKSDEEAGIGSDLVTTAATTINSLTLSDVDFTISGGTLSPGDLLDIRIAVAVNDGATGTAVIGQIGAIKLLCDTRG